MRMRINSGVAKPSLEDTTPCKAPSLRQRPRAGDVRGPSDYRAFLPVNELTRTLDSLKSSTVSASEVVPSDADKTSNGASSLQSLAEV